jgi:hypothetical protein
MGGLDDLVVRRYGLRALSAGTLADQGKGMGAAIRP